MNTFKHIQFELEKKQEEVNSTTTKVQKFQPKIILLFFKYMKLKNILTEKNQNRERTSCPLGKQTKKEKLFLLYKCIPNHPYTYGVIKHMHMINRREQRNTCIICVTRMPKVFYIYMPAILYM